MLSDREGQALLDIRVNLLLAQEFVAGHSLETFSTDRRTFYAVVCCLDIVCENRVDLRQRLGGRSALQIGPHAYPTAYSRGSPPPHASRAGSSA